MFGQGWRMESPQWRCFKRAGLLELCFSLTEELIKNVKQSLVPTLKKDNGQRQTKAITKTFATAVNKIGDPRTREVEYPLVEILLTALVAVCCGAESYYDFATFADQQRRWLRKFFPFKNGTPYLR